MSLIRPGKMAKLGLEKFPYTPFIYGVCEHTQGYNSSPIVIIFGIQLVWVQIKVGIVNEPYPTRENGSTGLIKIPYKPLHKYHLRELENTLNATILHQSQLYLAYS